MTVEAVPDPFVAEDGARDAALLAVLRELRSSGYRFTTVTPATHARVVGRPGRERARTVADVFGWSLPFADGVLPAHWFALLRSAGIVVPHEDVWRSTVRVSTLGDAMFVHSAYPTVAADAVFFGPDTYRFADAIERWLADGRPVGRAVDIGCGAGPGAIVVARARPSADVFAVDINDGALALTRLNAAINGARIDTRRSDLLSAVNGVFDLIVANPPYLLDRDERTYRHGGGRFGEGLSLSIAELARTRLAPGGTLLLYTGSVVCDGVDAFRDAVASRLAGSGLDVAYREVDPDVFGEELLEPAYETADRIAAVVATIARPAT